MVVLPAHLLPPASGMEKVESTRTAQRNVDNDFHFMIASSAGFDTPFDPVATASLRTGEMVNAIKRSGRQDPSSSEPDLIPSALLIQAGLRGLLPPSERTGIAMPGKPDSNDPEPLVKAQSNMMKIYQSGSEANTEQRMIAIQAVIEGASMLEKYGYTKAASILIQWAARVPF
ncbi:hypothetical protein [Synechococcus sp. WH 5701]|uniref:hypothetical protein n=1 Tax=Synechococcus sp. WH 5701 TaxID=69042 RepID=UPI003C70F588